MTIENLLNDPRISYLLFLPGRERRVLIAAPHHAPVGVPTLPIKARPTSDENTGLIAYHLSRSLDCPCLIAGNYFIDPNKKENTDYYNRIQSLKPRFLIEIHAHGSGAARFDIEITCGSREKSPLSQDLASRLQIALAAHPETLPYSISGNFDKIHFKATRSVTINTDQWIAYHIELPFSIRADTAKCKLFSAELSAIIVDMLAKK